ncbi:hypothetical protein [Chryseobacterium sp. MMS23-Vi53]|uniref:hypothetical protein n=1 Tax=Chryseobacterium sp. MMS23-Vi53 TaxID=3386644 RepID=UPI0039EACBEB
MKDIIKDRYSFIWLATDGGLVRYDGRQFLVYNKLKVKNLNFGSFLKNKDGNIIIFNNNEENCALLKNRNAFVLPNHKVEKTEFTANGKLNKRYLKSKFTGVFFPDTSCYYIETNTGIYTFYTDRVIYNNGYQNKTVLLNFPFSRLKNAFVVNNTVYLPDPKKRKTVILRDGNATLDSAPTIYNDPASKIYWHETSQQVFVINKGNIYINTKAYKSPNFRFLIKYKNIEKQLFTSIYYDEESSQLYLGNLIKGLNIITISYFNTPQRNIPYSLEVVYDALPYSQNAVITKQGYKYTNNGVEKIFSANVNYDRRFLLYDCSNNLVYVDFNKIHRRYRNSFYKKHDSITFTGRNVNSLFKINQNFVVSMADLDYSYYSLYLFTDDNFQKAKLLFRCKDNITSVIQKNHDLIYIGTSDGIYVISLILNKIKKKLQIGSPSRRFSKLRTVISGSLLTTEGFFLLITIFPLKCHLTKTAILPMHIIFCKIVSVFLDFIQQWLI